MDDGRNCGLSELQRRSFDELAGIAEPTDSVEVGGRVCSITTIVEHSEDRYLRVVVAGRMPAWLGHTLFLDGFYKAKDGSTTTMRSHDLRDEY